MKWLRMLAAAMGALNERVALIYSRGILWDLRVAREIAAVQERRPKMTSHLTLTSSAAKYTTAVLIGLFGLLARADTIVLEAPDDTKKAELDQCSAAIGKRMAALGIKGLKVAAAQKEGKSRVEVSLATEIPRDVRDKIQKIAPYLGQKVALQLLHKLTPDEESKVELPGPSNPAGKPPAGSHYLRIIGSDLALIAESRLIQDAPAATWADVTVTKRERDSWTFQVSPAASKAALPGVTASYDGSVLNSYGLYVQLDDVSFTKMVQVTFRAKGQDLKNATFSLPADFAELLEAIARNPMPKPLKPQEEKK